MDLTLVLAADSDSGEKDDGLTNDTTPTLTGKAEAGSSVQILADGDLLGTVVTNENGVFSYTSAALADASTTTFTAVALDAAGNTSATSKPLGVTIDATAPTAPTLVLAAASDSGEQGDGLTNDTTPTLTGKAEAGSSVRILADGDLLGTVVTNENGVFSYTVANADALDDGSTSFSAVALDEAGNTSKTSKELDITIDGSAPTPTAQTGTDGPDNLMGGATSDTLLGGGGDDVVMGLAGDDVVQGNRGNDLLFGNLGNDTLFGGQDADTVFGGQNDDVAQGNLGNDVVFGNLGNDTLYGGQGADLVFGGQGNDVLYGDLGNDVLSGDLGNDVLIGGAGADRYVFGANSGTDAVFGFSQTDGDRLDLQGQTYTFGTAANGSGSALLVLSGGGTIELSGVTQGQVNASFFA